MIVFCLFEGFNALLFLVGNLSCSTQNKNKLKILEVSLALSNFATILLAFASVALRLGHPFILNNIKKDKKEQDDGMRI